MAARGKAKSASLLFLEKQMKIDEKKLKAERDYDPMRWFQLVSDSQMFDLLYFDGKSAQLSISDTILFDSGAAIKSWLFNPQKKLKKKYTTILRKNKEHISSPDVLLKDLAGMSSEDAYSHKVDPQAYMNVGLPSSQAELDFFIRTKGRSVRSFDTTTSNDTFSSTSKGS